MCVCVFVFFAVTTFIVRLNDLPLSLAFSPPISLTCFCANVSFGTTLCVLVCLSLLSLFLPHCPSHSPVSLPMYEVRLLAFLKYVLLFFALLLISILDNVHLYIYASVIAFFTFFYRRFCSPGLCFTLYCVCLIRWCFFVIIHNHYINLSQ